LTAGRNGLYRKIIPVRKAIDFLKKGGWPMRYGKWLILLCLIFLCYPVSAEFFRYKDENGNIRYTDDYSQVPVGQRSKISSYEESRSAVEETVETQKKEETVQEKETPEPSKDEGEAKTQPDGSELDALKIRLDQTLQALEEERRALTQEKATIE